MNRAAFSEFWYRKHNKVLAIFFTSIAIALLLAYYLIEEIQSNWTYFSGNLSEIWNLFVYLIVYGLILFGNIRNDSIAYSGILMFIFYTAFDSARSFVTVSATIFGQSVTFNPLLIPYFIGWISLAGMVVIGIFWYIRSLQYMRGNFGNFKQIRLLGILYVVCLSATIITNVLTVALIDPELIHILIISWLIPLSDLFIGVASIFTMERLKRF